MALNPKKPFFILGLIFFIIGLIIISYGFTATTLYVNQVKTSPGDPNFAKAVDGVLFIGLIIFLIGLLTISISLLIKVTPISGNLSEQSGISREDSTQQSFSSTDSQSYYNQKIESNFSSTDDQTPDFFSIYDSPSEPDSDSFCPVCGAKVDQDEIFCNNCGKRLKISE